MSPDWTKPAGAGLKQQQGNTMNEQDFIYFIKNYAMDHYDTGGWDEVIEAWSDGDILEYWSDADGNENKAFKSIAKTVKLRHEYAEEIRKTAF